MLERKRRAHDDVLYVDLRAHGNMTRLFNDEQDDPPLRLFYWPPGFADDGTEPADAPLPRRIFLVASRAIPALTELTWDYGEEYHRPWLAAEEATRGVGGSDSEGSCTDSEAEQWTEVNWAQCDKCDKWRRLPPGPEYCDAALPEKWFCSMNPNSKRNTCLKPEERMGTDEVWEGAEGDPPHNWPQKKGAHSGSDEDDGDEADAGEEHGKPGLSRRAPHVVRTESFLANQSDSSDSDETRLQKRANRADMFQQNRQRRERPLEASRRPAALAVTASPSPSAPAAPAPAPSASAPPASTPSADVLFVTSHLVAPPQVGGQPGWRGVGGSAGTAQEELGTEDEDEDEVFDFEVLETVVAVEGGDGGDGGGERPVGSLGDGLYVVQKLRKERVVKGRNGQETRQFLVQWQGYKQPTWEAEENIIDKSLIEAFKRAEGMVAGKGVVGGSCSGGGGRSGAPELFEAEVVHVKVEEEDDEVEVEEMDEEEEEMSAVVEEEMRAVVEEDAEVEEVDDVEKVFPPVGRGRGWVDLELD